MATVISLVSYPFLPAKMGGQKGVALFYKYFGRWHRVVCVTTQKNEPGAAEGYEVLNILSNSAVRYINPFYYFKLRRIIQEKKASHFILEHPYYGWLAVLLKWTCPIKLVVHSHNMEGLRWKTLGKWWWPILWQYEKWVHRRADYNFFIQDADKEYAIEKFSLRPERCITVTFGLEREKAPEAADIAACRRAVREKHGIAPEESVLLFNGAFNYAPNLHALEHLVKEINPTLQGSELRYKLLICGKDIPKELIAIKNPNVLYAGFVDDIDVYYKGADIFLNPIVEGGGIKTKLVEALGNNLTCVSVRTGAIGIEPAWCNGKLLICEDYDWKGFVALIGVAVDVTSTVGSAYFDHFYWGSTTQKAAAFIEGR